MTDDTGRLPSAPGSREPSPAVSAVPASIPSAVLDHVASAIERAGCPRREGPYGGYDYGHNTAFYGPEPEGGRYVVRDFRDPRSPDWGKWVHQTHCRDEHEQTFARLTGRHIAQAAINAYAQAIEARSGETRQGLDPKDESAGPQGCAQPTPGASHD